MPKVGRLAFEDIITRFHPVTASGLDPSLHFDLGILCCVHLGYIV